LSGSYPLDLNGKGGPTSSYVTAGIALRVSGALKPHHHDKVEIPLVGVGKLKGADSVKEGLGLRLRPRVNLFFLYVSNVNVRNCQRFIIFV
jgi:hypothetical protein